MKPLWTIDDVATELHTAVLSDILDAVGCREQVADAGIRPIQPGMRMVGRAKTASASRVTEPPAEPYKKLLELIDEISTDDIVVLDVAGRTDSAIFGGLLATAVQSAGGRGVLIDGLTRDAEEIIRLDMPTFSRGFRPVDSYGRDEVTEVGGVVQIGGVSVSPGDLVVADMDGIVAIPRAIEEEVVERAFAKVRAEQEMRLALKGGMRVREAFAVYGIL
jgi:regulator of RNase E activity RraA